MVLSGDPDDKLHVVDIEDDTRAQDLEIVFGVGVKDRLSERGYRGLDRWEIVRDVVFGEHDLDPRAVVRDVLPTLQVNFPVFKYLRAVDALDENGEILAEADVSKRVMQMANKIRKGMPASASHQKRAKEFLKDYDSITQLLDALGPEQGVVWMTVFPRDKVDPAELLSFLRESYDWVSTDPWRTQYPKIVCLYDWLAFGRTPVSG